jgi:hypothetical protein
VPGDLILFPLRLGLRVAGIALHPFVKVAERVLGADGRPEPAEYPEPEPVPEPYTEPAPVPSEPLRREPESRADEPAEPVHIEVEEELVAQVADPGAEEGPGPQLSVDEPWEGYSKMKAADIVDRLAAAGPAEVAVVQLYESTHRRRKTVLDAAGHSQRK